MLRQKVFSIKDSLIEVKDFIKKKIRKKDYNKFDYLFSTSSREIIDILKKSRLWSIGAQMALLKIDSTNYLLVLELIAFDGKFTTGLQISRKFETVNILREELVRNVLSRRNLKQLFEYSQS